MAAETPGTHKRAAPNETPEGDERAARAETPVASERAGRFETPAGNERAGGAETPAGNERGRRAAREPDGPIGPEPARQGSEATVSPGAGRALPPGTVGPADKVLHGYAQWCDGDFWMFETSDEPPSMAQDEATLVIHESCPMGPHYSDEHFCEACGWVPPS